MALYERFLLKSEFDSYADFYNNFRLEVPDNYNFAYDVLDVQAQEKPDAPALVWEHEDGRTRTFTYKEISDLSKQAAAALYKIGIRRGDAVMLVLRRHYSFWIAIMALHRLGVIVIPATHLLTKKDIIYRCESASVKMIIASAEGGFIDYADQARSECSTLQWTLSVDGHRDGWVDFEALIASEEPVFERYKEPFTEDEIMLLYFTSGTSGMPKMVVHAHDYSLAHLLTAAYWQQCEEGGLHLTVAETGWGKCAWGKLYGQWLSGCCIMVYDFERFVPSKLLDILEKYPITSFCAPPTIYRFMLLEDLSKRDLSSIKHFSTAGEALAPDVFARWKEFTGIQIHEAFGQTETCVSVGTFPWMEVHPSSMGKPSPLYNIDIIDEDGNSCPPGQIGELVIRTDGDNRIPGLFLGYYRDEERTRSVWNNGVYHTMDLVWKDEWGYLWYVGRADDVIKSSGYRIGPFEVESALAEHPAVVESAVTGVPDPVRGQVVKATIVLAKGYEPSDDLIKDIQNFVKKATAPYKYPRIIEFVQELPKTISNKIQRSELRKRDAERAKS